jgi:hypothetical protein
VKPKTKGRHSRNCTVCAQKDRENIEGKFINWTSAKAIAKEIGLKDRNAVYRHAGALGLFTKRHYLHLSTRKQAPLVSGAAENESTANTSYPVGRLIDVLRIFHRIYRQSFGRGSGLWPLPLSISFFGSFTFDFAGSFPFVGVTLIGAFSLE